MVTEPSNVENKLRILFLDQFSTCPAIVDEFFSPILYDYWEIIYPEALEFAVDYLRQTQFDCIIFMAGKIHQSVLDLLSDIRVQTAVPILALTLCEADAIAVLQAGAQDYLTLEDWQDTKMVEHSIHHLLHRHRHAHQISLGDPSGLFPKHPAPLSDQDLIDHYMRIESEECLRFIFDQVPIGIACTDPQGKILRVNQKYCDDFGYTCEELTRLNFQQLTYPEDLAENLKYRQQLIVGEIDQFCLEKRFIRKDQSIWWAHITVSAIRYPNGQLKGALVLVEDISELKRTEAALHESEGKLSRLIANLPGVSYRYLEHPDGSGTFLYISPRCQEVYGYCSEELVQSGDRLWSLIHPEDVVIFQDMVSVSCRTLQPLFNEHRIITTEGFVKWIQISAQPERLETGDILWDGFAIDITDRKHAEFMHMQYFAESRDWRQRYEVAGLASDQILFEWNLDKDQPIWGPNTERILGFSQSEMPQTLEQWIARIHPDDQSIFIQQLHQYSLTSNTFRLEYRVRCKNDAYIWVEDKNKVFSNDIGQPKSLLGFIGDITPRKQVELELRKSESRFRKLSESVSIGIFQTDLEGNINYANPYLHKIEGAPELNKCNRNWTQLLHPEDRARVLSEFHQCMAENQPLLSEFRIFQSQEESIWVLGQITSITLENGEIVGYIGNLTDITTQKQAEELLQRLNEHLEQRIADRTTELQSVAHKLYLGNELRQYLEKERQHTEAALSVTKAQLQAMLDAVPGCVMWVNSDLVCLGVNPYMTNLLQRLSEELLIGQRINNPGSNLQSIVNFIENFFLDPQSNHTEECEITIGSETKYYLFIGQKYSNNKMAVFVGTDITQRKIIEIEKTKIIEKNQELIDLKSNFIAVASHEFRTPLTTILTASELLESYHDQWDEEKNLKYLKRIQQSVSYMTNLLEDILVMNQSEIKKIKLNISQFCVIDFCKDIIEEVKLGSRNSHSIIFDSKPEKYMVKMDEKVLRHVLLNLLSNSIKYSQKNTSIKLKISSDEKELFFEIIDCGIGIPEEDQKDIFDPFYRAKNSGTIPGTGLGLSIVKNMIELHGGTISFNSIIGQGTQFKFSLPLS
ncbi:MAG: PAS domain S-box protein [Thermosynechococcaceae cyanobacterium]